VIRAALVLALGAPAQLAAQSWTPQSSGSTADLRGLHAVSSSVVWASGSRGTVLRTVDSGVSWVARPVPGADSLDFRDVFATDTARAVILAIGPGEKSRIYQTNDGGATWSERFRNTRAEGFFDCMAFRDERNGIAVSDPVDGKFVVIRTNDGGTTWTQVPPHGIPAAQEGEGAFAASGTCVATDGTRNAWIVTGGVKQPRVFRSTDAGLNWSVTTAPLAGEKPGAGIFSVIFDGRRGVAVGGDYEKPAEAAGTLALSDDGGATWRVSSAPPDSLLRGYRSGVARAGTRRNVLIAVGTSGSDISRDGGRSWAPLGDTGYNVVARAADGSTWAAGPRGRIARLSGEAIRVEKEGVR
jgi:photosystem II stability/assembly factor-like uncharacterized protein